MVSLAKSTNGSPDSSTGRQSINFSRNPSPQAMSPQAMSPPGTRTPATYKPTGSNSIASGVSTPATYHTAANYRHSSQTTNTNTTTSPTYSHNSYAPSLVQSTHPAPPPPSSNISRNSLILPTHQQQQQQHPLSPTVSRASLISQASRLPAAATTTPAPTPKDVSRRGSRGTMSGMSPTVQALYGQHERDWRRSQNVLPEELVARGLDEGVFAGLR